MRKQEGDKYLYAYYATSIDMGSKFIKDALTSEQLDSMFQKKYDYDFLLAFLGSLNILEGTTSVRLNRLINNPDPTGPTRQEVVDNFVKEINLNKVLLGKSTSINLVLYLMNGLDIEDHVLAAYEHRNNKGFDKTKFSDENQNYILSQFANSLSTMSNITALVHTVRNPDLTNNESKDNYLKSTKINLEKLVPTGILASIQIIREIDLFENIGQEAAECASCLNMLLEREGLVNNEIAEFITYNLRKQECLDSNIGIPYSLYHHDF